MGAELEHMDVRVPVAPGAQTGLRRQKHSGLAEVP